MSSHIVGFPGREPGQSLRLSINIDDKPCETGSPTSGHGSVEVNLLEGSGGGGGGGIGGSESPVSPLSSPLSPPRSRRQSTTPIVESVCSPPKNGYRSLMNATRGSVRHDSEEIRRRVSRIKSTNNEALEMADRILARRTSASSKRTSPIPASQLSSSLSSPLAEVQEVQQQNSTTSSSVKDLLSSPERATSPFRDDGTILSMTSDLSTGEDPYSHLPSKLLTETPNMPREKMLELMDGVESSQQRRRGYSVDHGEPAQNIVAPKNIDARDSSYAMQSGENSSYRLDTATPPQQQDLITSNGMADTSHTAPGKPSIIVPNYESFTSLQRISPVPVSPMVSVSSPSISVRSHEELHDDSAAIPADLGLDFAALSLEHTLSSRSHLQSLEPDNRMPKWVQQRRRDRAATKDVRTGTNNDPNIPSPSTHSSSSSDASSSSISDMVEECGIFKIRTSKTTIVHKVNRGNWTWCCAWSPDGNSLAMATENHNLAVCDTSLSTVWKVRHDTKIEGPFRNNTTHTIRSIAWGAHFIAIGGTGDSVSILAPSDPYPIVHTIPSTGFVGALNWRRDSSVLAIGNREDQCLVVNISCVDDDDDDDAELKDQNGERRMQSKSLYTFDRKDWVNTVKFSHDGTAIAIGDRSGLVSVYVYGSGANKTPTVAPVVDVNLGCSVLAVEWSPDGQYLYASGEDFSVTIVSAEQWEVVQKVSRDRWVPFVACSNGGSHLAVGGSTSSVSILDVSDGWENVYDIKFGRFMPLSAKWHPADQFLAITGQDNNIVAVETTDARHMLQQIVQCTSAVNSIDCSPDGKTVVVGNRAGVVSFFELFQNNFVLKYEMVIGLDGAKSVRWSSDGTFVAVGGGDTVAIVNTAPKKHDSTILRSPSGYSLRQIIRGLKSVKSVRIEKDSKHVMIGGAITCITDASNNFAKVKELKRDDVLATAWSPDGTFFALIGKGHNLGLYDSSNEDPAKWKLMFTLQCEEAGLALSWGPTASKGLQYLAYGGIDQTVTVIELRTRETTWETVLALQQEGKVNDLDWSSDGMLAVGIDDGTVAIIDLAYLHSGQAVNEMDYNWQRQGMTCTSEIRRNEKNASISTVRWTENNTEGGLHLAVGGVDGVVEIFDMSERRLCKGFSEQAL